MAGSRRKKSPWRRALKVATVILAVFVVVMVAAIGGLYAYIQSGAGLREATARASALLGREIRIGAADVSWGRVTHIDLTDIEVENVDWAETEHFLEAGKLSVDIELWPLLWGEVVIPRLAVDKPNIYLQKNSDGEVNWSFGAQPVVNQVGQTIAPEERDEMPALDHVDISEGTLQFRDDAKNLLIDGVLSLATGEATGAEAVRFNGEGSLEDRPLKIDFTGASFASLKDGDAPYPLKLSVRFGRTAIDVEGTMVDPIAMEGTDLQLTLEGPDLADVFPVLGVPAPPTPPYRLTGRLLREGDVWAFEGMDGVVGDSDLAGSVRIDYGPERPELKADLTSKLLDFDDLAPLIGAPPDTEGETASAEQEETADQLEANDNLFPDVPLNLEKLKVMDMDVTLVAEKVRSESYLAVTSLSGHVAIDNGRAVLDPFKLGIAEGHIEGQVVLNARSEPASLAADLSLRQLNLATFFQESPYFDTTDGKIDGFVNLTGNGASLADVMASADGDTRIAMQGGAISWLLVELIGLDLGQALILYITEDNKIPINCGAGKIDFAHGVASFEPVVIDTTDSVLYFSGKTDLKAQTITLQVEADAKDFSLLDIDVPLLIDGKIRNPDISLGKGVPIPLIEPGNAEDLRCEDLVNTILSATN